MPAVRGYHVVSMGRLWLRLIATSRPEVVFSRAILFGIENYPEKDDNDMWLRFRDHMKEKYGAFWLSEAMDTRFSEC